MFVFIHSVKYLLHVYMSNGAASKLIHTRAGATSFLYITVSSIGSTMASIWEGLKKYLLDQLNSIFGWIPFRVHRNSLENGMMKTNTTNDVVVIRPVFHIACQAKCHQILKVCFQLSLLWTSMFSAGSVRDFLTTVARSAVFPWNKKEEWIEVEKIVTATRNSNKYTTLGLYKDWKI